MKPLTCKCGRVIGEYELAGKGAVSFKFKCHCRKCGVDTIRIFKISSDEQQKVVQNDENSL